MKLGTDFCAPKRAFTLLEVLVSIAVLVLLLAMILSVIQSAGSSIRYSLQKVDAFESARHGMEALTQSLRRAVLQTYWDYFDANRNPRTPQNATTFVPALYGRQSDLHFKTGPGSDLPNWDAVGHAIFFQRAEEAGVPTRPPRVVAPSAFFVTYGPSPAFPNISRLQNQNRFRLMQWLPSAESLLVDAAGKVRVPDWMNDLNADVFPVAEDILTMVVQVPTTNYRVADGYGWDSRMPWQSGPQPSQMHQLPPMLQVTLVAIDAAAAERALSGATTAATAYAALGLPEPRHLFTNPAAYDNDLARLTQQLSNRNIPYRVFRTGIPLPNSQWSP